jgi:hypothetical protein
VLNQPAGHLEANETLTSKPPSAKPWRKPAGTSNSTGVVGIYLYTAPSNGVTYQRVCFSPKPLKHHPDRAAGHRHRRRPWLTREELAATSNWRSELIIRCIDDYLAGIHFGCRTDPPFSLALQARAC